MDALKSGCAICGEKDPIVLDFDHINQQEKCCSVSALIGKSETRLCTEIAKCQILCANCHRRKTSKQFMWTKGQL